MHLRGLNSLKYLDLTGTKVTDAGLVHLKGLANLEALMLTHTQVTDAGLVHLEGLANLKCLDLRRSPQVTDEGVEKLQQSLPDCEISH